MSERRLHVGMTQQQLAQAIGVAFQQVHKYETGISPITVDRLYRIATALDAPVGDCVSSEDNLTKTVGEIAEHRKCETSDVG